MKYITNLKNKLAKAALTLLLALFTTFTAKAHEGYDINQRAVTNMPTAFCENYGPGWFPVPVVTAPNGTVLIRGIDYALHLTFHGDDIHPTVTDDVTNTNMPEHYDYAKDTLGEFRNETMTITGIGTNTDSLSFDYRNWENYGMSIYSRRAINYNEWDTYFPSTVSKYSNALWMHSTKARISIADSATSATVAVYTLRWLLTSSSTPTI